MRRHSALITIVAASLLPPAIGLAQPNITFPNRTPTATVASTSDTLSVADILDIRTVSVADLSSDGRWLAITVTQRRDGLGNDFSRDGDPTYVRGNPGELLVVDTRNLAQRPVFKGKTTVRGTSWSPDGSRLAMFVVNNETQQLQVWDRVTGKVVRLPT